MSSTTVALPAIVGKTRAEATSLLVQKHILANFVDEDAPDKPPGTVLRTDPVEGTPIQKAFPFVTVTVAKAPQVAVPDVSTLDAVTATSTIAAGRAHGVAGGPVGVELDDCPGPGGQHRPGRRRTLTGKGSEVTLIISTGPPLVDVPDVRGKTRAEAESILTGAGLSVRIHSQAVVPPQVAGTVLDQSPADGQVAQLTFIDITVGT